jgi:hypothetical protein
MSSLKSYQTPLQTDFSRDVSFLHGFCLQHFCSPLFGLFRFVPGWRGRLALVKNVIASRSTSRTWSGFRQLNFQLFGMFRLSPRLIEVD